MLGSHKFKKVMSACIHTHENQPWVEDCIQMNVQQAKNNIPSLVLYNFPIVARSFIFYSIMTVRGNNNDNNNGIMFHVLFVM